MNWQSYQSENMTREEDLELLVNDYASLTCRMSRLLKEQEAVIEFERNYKRSANIKTYKRIALTKVIRNKVLNKNNFRCIKCGAKRNLEIDHIKPISDEGTNDIENLQTLCYRCHKRKSKSGL